MLAAPKAPTPAENRARTGPKPRSFGGGRARPGSRCKTRAFQGLSRVWKDRSPSDHRRDERPAAARTDPRLSLEDPTGQIKAANSKFILFYLTGIIHGTAIPGLRARLAARPRPSPPSAAGAARARSSFSSFLPPAAPGRRSRRHPRPPTGRRGGLRDGAHERQLLSGGTRPSAPAAGGSRPGAGGGKAASRSGAHLRGKEEGEEQEPQAEPRRQRRPHAHLMLSRRDAGAAPAAVAAGERNTRLRRTRPLYSGAGAVTPRRLPPPPPHTSAPALRARRAPQEAAAPWSRCCGLRSPCRGCPAGPGRARLLPARELGSHPWALTGAAPLSSAGVVFWYGGTGTGLRLLSCSYSRETRGFFH